MTETIQQLKEDIAILQEKLQKLEELQRTKSPAEEAFRKVYYRYPDKLDDKYGSAWDIFEKGYNASKVTEVEPSMTNCVLLGNPPDGYVTWNEWYNEMGSKGILHNLTISSKDYKPTPQERGNQIHKEVENEIEKLQEKNWYVDAKTILKPHWEPTPQTPEQTEQGLKQAVREAVKQGVVSSTTKRQTLRDVCQDWWGIDDADSYCIDDLVDRIENWLPTEHDTNSYKWNECIRMMRENLR